jgi:tetratricopeptide (TPR) repeat protein
MVTRAVFTSRFSSLILVSLVISACGGTGTKTSQPERVLPAPSQSQVVSEAPVIVAEVGLSPRERLTKAINSLERGQSEIALVELEAYSQAVPNSSRAANLIRQINTAPEDYFPAEYFTVALKSGQSLSTLAKRYLGSAWEFYALAKYNGINNPSRVNIGTEIKVPLTQMASDVKQQEEQMTDDSLADAGNEEASDAGDETEGSALIAAEEVDEFVDESAELAVETEQEVIITEASLIEALVAANAAFNYAESISIVESLKDMGALSVEAEEQVLVALEGQAESIIQDDPSTAANLYLEAGQMYLDNGNELAAFERFKSAEIIDVTNETASKQMQTLQKQITEKYHREASTAFRQQSLAEAIEKWDIVLSVDPNHSNAMAYRTQALELQERLNLLKNN